MGQTLDSNVHPAISSQGEEKGDLPASHQQPSLTELAEEILVNAKLLDAYTSKNNLPNTSFHLDTLAKLPADLKTAQKALVNQSHRLRQLAEGPVGSINGILFSPTDLLSLRAIYEYNIPSYIPIEGTTTFASLSASSGIAQPLLTRLIKHAMSNHIFIESPAGQIQHSAISRLMVQDPEFPDWIATMACETAPPCSSTMEALSLYPGSEEPNETGFCLANKTELSTFVFLAQHPERARRFGAGMRFMTRNAGWDLKYLVSGYDWAALDRTRVTFVDVGGGHGAVSRALASTTSHMKFIVQDLPETASEGRELLSASLRDRVSFQGHDFFNEQPVKGADVYFFRWIMHILSNKYCIRVLRALIPALKHGAKVLVYEFSLGERASTERGDKMNRDMDLVMMAMNNSCERTDRDWRDLFKRADERFELVGFRTPEGSAMGFVEVVWKG